jgi:hypothetical protein
MPPLARGTVNALMRRWDVATLSWVVWDGTPNPSTGTSRASSNSTPITTATDTTVVAAPAAGNHLKIYRLHASNSSATGTWVYWRNGAAGTRYYAAYLPQNGIISLNLNGAWELDTATALVITTTGAGNVEWHVDYLTEPD